MKKKKSTHKVPAHNKIDQNRTAHMLQELEEEMELDFGNFSSMEELNEAYNSLGDLEKAVLALKSVTFCFISNKLLTKYLSELGFRDDKGKKLTQSTIDEYLDNLIEGGFLDREYSPLIESLEYIDFLTERAVELQCYNEILEIAYLHIENQLKSAPDHSPDVQMGVDRETVLFSGMRVAFMKNDQDSFMKYKSLGAELKNSMQLTQHLFSEFIYNSFTVEQLDAKCLYLQDYIISRKIHVFLFLGVPSEDLFILEDRYKTLIAHHPEFQDSCAVFLNMLLLRGKLSEVESLLAEVSYFLPATRKAYLASIAFLKGENAESIELYQEALELLKEDNDSQESLQDLHGFFFLLALVRSKESTHRSLYQSFINEYIEISPIHSGLGVLVQAIFLTSEGQVEMADDLLESSSEMLENPPYVPLFSVFLILFSHLAMPGTYDDEFKENMVFMITNPPINLLPELAKILVQILHDYHPSDKTTVSLLKNNSSEGLINYADFLDSNNL